MKRAELVCPAGALPALKAAVDNGADAVYLGFRDGTNARNFPGLNFGPRELESGFNYAHARGRRVYVAINTYPLPAQWRHWCHAVDRAVDLGADALILADTGLLDYTAERHPQQRLHLSVQGSATSHEAIDFYARHFGVRRAVLPRVLALPQVELLLRRTGVEIEVFGFGSLCVMVEGRCALSSFVTGESPNSGGVCSPARAVRWEEAGERRRWRLNGVLIDEYGADEAAGYPTLCKGRFAPGAALADGGARGAYYALEEPTSLNVLEILPRLVSAGVTAIKVEGRQRGPAYVAKVTRVLRAALDACVVDCGRYTARAAWMEVLNGLSEGNCHTLGAYHRPWQ